MGHNTKFIVEKQLWKQKNVKLVILVAGSVCALL